VLAPINQGMKIMYPKLDAQQEARALKLQQESLVVDDHSDIRLDLIRSRISLVHNYLQNIGPEFSALVPKGL
jgi:hypothetical protein